MLTHNLAALSSKAAKAYRISLKSVRKEAADKANSYKMPIKLKKKQKRYITTENRWVGTFAVSGNSSAVKLVIARTKHRVSV
ncbi:hypothetical protein E4U53_006797 [Claviceps sorghi]|nr:hypothetical protein E4U53_006797 [Claviceps sorghi]